MHAAAVRLAWLVRILCLCALVPAAHAQAIELPLGAADPEAPQDAGFSIRIESAMTSDIYSTGFRQRALNEREQREFRFGVHAIGPDLPMPSLQHRTPIRGDSRFNFVQELRWPGGESLTGLQFERSGFLFPGDRISIRSTSDVQTLARGAGLLGAGTGTDLMSFLGWRSHSQLQWQLGEPTREIQWSFTARMDRRSSNPSSAVDLQILRRF